MGRASASVHVLEREDWCTRILLLHKDPSIIQRSYYCTKTLILYKDPTIIHRSYSYAKILLLYKDPTIIQGSCYYTRVLLLYTDPTIIQASDGHRCSRDLVSEKRLGCVRTITRSRNLIRVYLDRWRGLERSLEVCF